MQHVDVETLHRRPAEGLGQTTQCNFWRSIRGTGGHAARPHIDETFDDGGLTARASAGECLADHFGGSEEIEPP